VDLRGAGQCLAESSTIAAIATSLPSIVTITKAMFAPTIPQN